MNRLLMQVETTGGAGTGKEERESPIQHLLQKQSKLVKEITLQRVFVFFKTYLHKYIGQGGYNMFFKTCMKIDHGGYNMFFKAFFCLRRGHLCERAAGGSLSAHLQKWFF